MSKDSERENLGTSGMLHYVTEAHDLTRASYSKTLHSG